MGTPKIHYDYLDAIKGVAILCITLLHFEDGLFPVWLNSWIGLFMITAFYFTSGWLNGLKTVPVPPGELFRKRFRQLGIPYLWFSLLILAFDLLLVACGFMELKIFFRDLYKTIVLHGIGTLWFLPVLLFGEWLFCVIRTCRYPWPAAALGLIATLTASCLYHNLWYPLRNLDDLHRILDAPMCPIVWSLKAWPVIGLGFLAGRRLKPLLQLPHKLQTAGIGISLILFSLWLVIAPPFRLYYVNELICQTFPVFGFMCLFAILPANPVSGFFIYWGRNSLILMCTHFSITEEIFKIFDRVVLHHESFSGISTLVYFALAVLLTYPMVRLFHHKLGFMLGKGRPIQKAS